MVDQEVIERASQLLDQLVVGHFIVGFSTGDVWVMRLADSDYQIACHDFSSILETSVNQTLRETSPDLFDCTDPDDIAKATVLSALTRRTILSASIKEDASLSVIFEGDLEMVLTTSMDVVDWQWCITKNIPEPYHADFELACLWKGEVSLGSTNGN